MNADLKTKKVTKSILSPRKNRQDFLKGAEIARYHRYRIEYKKGWHEIVCPKYIFADESGVIVIPWYLILGRPYPIQIYLYACGVYSSNPDMGQRGAAEATRKEFNLKKFSHSTVSRSFRDFEKRRVQELERRFGGELKVCGLGNASLVGAAEKGEPRRDGSWETAGRFPTVADTGRRREGMAVFLRGFLYACEKANIEAAARRFVGGWNKKVRRLLL